MKITDSINVIPKLSEDQLTDLSNSYRSLLQNIGEDPKREGLIKTPMRAAKSLDFLTHGYRLDPKAILKSALFHEDYKQIVVVKDIEIYSLCEHHLLLSSANNSAFPSSWHIIPSGASSEYVAHKEIVLRDGFHAAQGSDFHAYITPCASCDDTPSRFNPAQIMENRSQRLTTDQNTLHKTPIVKDLVHIYPNPAQTQVTVVSEQ